MKYVDRTYTDGTEPDVFRFCCDNLCEQGRQCPARQAAEAATEVGQKDEDVTRLFRASDLLAGIVIVAVLAFLVGWITK